jgi:hypothetical protein
MVLKLPDAWVLCKCMIRLLDYDTHTHTQFINARRLNRKGNYHDLNVHALANAVPP